MRRIVKPFAVEVRNGGRRQKVEAAGPLWPQFDQQPDVIWPGTTSSSEPYRDPRKAPPTDAVQPEDQAISVAEMVGAKSADTKPAGRILRDLNEASPVPEVKPVQREAPKRTKRQRPVLPIKPVFEQVLEPALRLEAGTKAVAAKMVLRKAGRG